MAKIMGNIVGLPSPRSDWNQTDETKADYIKNKPLKEIQAMKSLQYYGDANIVPSDASLFEFTLSPIGGGVAIHSVAKALPSDVVIPFRATVDGETLPVTFLWDNAFTFNRDVTSLVLPNTINEIGISAFEGCTSLKSITIPDSVTMINTDAFFGCQTLEDVYFTGTKAQWDAITIGTGNLRLDEDRATIHYGWSDVTKKYVDEKLSDIDDKLEKISFVEHTGGILLDIPNNKIFVCGVLNESLTVEINNVEAGYTSALYFTTPSEIPTNYTTFPAEVKFKGDSTDNGAFVPEANTRYTMVFDYDGANIIGYVSGVSV